MVAGGVKFWRDFDCTKVKLLSRIILCEKLYNAYLLNDLLMIILFQKWHDEEEGFPLAEASFVFTAQGGRLGRKTSVPGVVGEMGKPGHQFFNQETSLSRKSRPKSGNSWRGFQRKKRSQAVLPQSSTEPWRLVTNEILTFELLN